VCIKYYSSLIPVNLQLTGCSTPPPYEHFDLNLDGDDEDDEPETRGQDWFWFQENKEGDQEADNQTPPFGTQIPNFVDKDTESVV